MLRRIGMLLGIVSSIVGTVVTLFYFRAKINQQTEAIKQTQDSLVVVAKEFRDFRAGTIIQDSTMWAHITLAAYQLPDNLLVCGQKVPIDRLWVRAKIDKEMYNFLKMRHLLVMWWKLSGLYFPMIEQTLKDLGLPDDLKYLAILESLLDPRAVSRARAVGMWQFMRLTGIEYGLTQNHAIDERRDPWSSTKAAGEYFLDLERIVRLRLGYTDWALVLAAYNAGPGRVNGAMARQGNHDYWTLDLPNDAERYYAQFVALVVLFSNPEMLGLTGIPRYKPLPEIKDTVITLRTSGSYKSLADSAGLSLDEFMLINTAYKKTDKLPKGQYRVRHIKSPEIN